VQQAKVRPGSHADLDAAVLEAVRQWRYEPQPVVRDHVIRLVVSRSS
jgi:outer membrane biosynthesis protein TonB